MPTTTTRKKKSKTKTKDKEMTRLGYALRTLGGLGGGYVGGMFGEPTIGAGIGSTLGANISKWLGSGDYKVAANSMLSPSGSVPVMHNEQQSVIVRHKEYIGIINSSQNFSVQYSLPLNPGLERTFPWLSSIASMFQEYRIRGLVFHYIPSSVDAIASTNPALGTVMLQTSYRSTDTVPSTKLEILNEYWASENVPSQPFCHPIECDPKENPFNIQYVRSMAVPSTENQLMYDLGVTHVATQGMQTTGNPVGDLWVTYEVELKKPIITSNVTMQLFSYNAQFSGVTVTTSNFFTGTVVKNSYNTTDGVTYSGRTITLPAGLRGVYAIIIEIGTVTAGSFNVGAAFTNIASTPSWFGSTGIRFSRFTAADGDSIFWMECVAIASSNSASTITVEAPSWTGTPSVCNLTIMQVA